MSSDEQQKIETDLINFTSRNFEKPGDCRNTDQVRFYVAELYKRIDECEKYSNYVPDWAYALLAQYNHALNRLGEGVSVKGCAS